MRKKTEEFLLRISFSKAVFLDFQSWDVQNPVQHIAINNSESLANSCRFAVARDVKSKEIALRGKKEVKRSVFHLCEKKLFAHTLARIFSRLYI